MYMKYDIIIINESERDSGSLLLVNSIATLTVDCVGANNNKTQNIIINYELGIYGFYEHTS